MPRGVEPGGDPLDGRGGAAFLEGGVGVGTRRQSAVGAVSGDTGQRLRGRGISLDVLLQGVGVPGHVSLETVGQVEGEDQRGEQQHHPDDPSDEGRPRPQESHPAGETLAQQGEDQQGHGRTQGEGDGEDDGPGTQAVGGTDDGDGGEHRTGAGDEDQTQAETEDESPAVAPVTAPARRAKGTSRSVADRGDDQPEPDQPEDDQADPPQRVEREAQRARASTTRPG